MENYIPKTFRQFLALLLCAAMLVPMIPAPAFAAEAAETGTENPAPTESETLPAEDGSAVTEPGSQEETESAQPTEPPVSQDNAGEFTLELDAALAEEPTAPDYDTAGKVSETMEYDCGNGVANDGSKSYLTIVTGTNSDEFTAYKQKLEDNGYELKMEKEIASDVATPNLFASYLSPDGSFKLYTYHFPHYGETRIIVDTQADTVEGFLYTPQGGTEVKPMLAMYGLSMATNGYDTQLTTTNYAQGRRNCGALVVIRMPDNSLFIHDGGDIQQWSDNACDEFLAFCRELTGTTGTDEKMVINTWFLSHAHTDHYLGFPRFINKYHDHFDLKNIVYNIDIERTYTTRDIHAVMQLVSNHYPNVRYYKPHTGESFEIAGVQFDVMYAHEDRYLPNADGQLITDYPEIENGKTTTEYDLGGTYRGYCYDTANDPTTQSDFNDTSTVLRVTFKNGVKSILYADMNRVEQTLFDLYPDSALEGDIVMVPHHGFDAHPELMAMSGATVFLYTQHKQAIYGPDGDYTTDDGEEVVRDRLLKHFKTLMNALTAAGRVEGTDYKFYWAGCETAVIDIDSMSGQSNGTADELPNMTLDTATPGRIAVYTSEANDDIYSNAWTIYDLDDGTDTLQATTGIKTDTHLSKFERYTGIPKVGGHYVIRSDAHPEYVMSYSAVAETAGKVNLATHLVQTSDNPITSTATNLFYEATVSGTETLYTEQSNRDNILWILQQYTYDDTNEVLKKRADGKDLAEYTKNKDADNKNIGWIGGTDSVDYRRISFQKGTYSTTEPYWYAVDGKDGGNTQYRFLDQRYVDTQKWIRNAMYAVDTENSTHDMYFIEKLSDGTYLIYFRYSETDYRILTCDENGNWKTKRYNGYSTAAKTMAAIEADLDELKVRLYVYKEQTGYKTIDFSGSTFFDVDAGTSRADILDTIRNSIAVDNTDRRNLAVPCSGDTPKIGYYWVDFGENFDSSKPGIYEVTVKYRDDDNDDTNIQTLTVYVGISAKVTGTATYTVMEGTSQTAVEELIANSITVKQTAGDTELKTYSYSKYPTMGDYYWLDFNVPFDSVNGSEIYAVSVKYRNPDGSDAVADTILTVAVKPLNLAFTGAAEYVVQEGVTEAQVRAKISESITVTANNLSGGRDTVPYAAAPTAGSYWLEFDSAFSSAADGDHDYFVKVWYRNDNGTDTLVETVAVYVEQPITSWTAPVDKVGTVPVNAGLTTVAQKVEGEISKDITFTVNGQTRYVTVGLLTDDKKPVDTSKTGTYENLTLTYMGQVICEDFTLIVTESNEALDYPQKGQDGYVGVDKDSTTPNEEFKETGVANIQLSASGTPPKRGVDLIVIMDLSGSMLNEMGTNVDAADYKNSRTVAMENSLKDMIQMLAESGADVTIAMSDFGDVDHYMFEGAAVDKSILHEATIDINNDNARYISSSNENKEYEFTNHLNYVFRSGEAIAKDGNGRAVSKIGTFANVHTKFNMAHPQYTGVIPPTVYTGTGEVEAGAFVQVSELYKGGFTSTMNDIITKIDENAHNSLGTNYDIGLEYAYQLAYAKQQENIANGNGEERDVVCIFMSDGAAMQYNYFSGRSDSQSWSDYLLGTFDSIGSTGITAANVPTQLEDISERMLTALQAGDLVRWEYHRDAPAPKLYKNVGDTEYFDESYDEGEYFIYRMRSDKKRDRDTSSFYGYMEDLGFDLDWEYLCAIARANGIEGFNLEYYQSNPRLPELIDKLLVQDTLLGYEKVGDVYYEVYQTDLVNPGLDEIQYYPIPATEPTGNTSTEKFLNAMESIGINCTWNLYGKIAFKNRNKDISGEKNTYEIEHALKQLAAAMKNVGNNEVVSYSPYSYFYNADGKNWWAEAIKGNTNQLYPVINKYAFEDSTEQPFAYYGDTRNNFSTGTGLALDGQDYIAGFRGLDVDMYTISFSICDDQLLKVATAEQVLKNIASGPSYFFTANTEDELTECMQAIVSSMSNAATRAWFTDTMGEQYDLYVGQPEMKYTKGEAVSTIHFYENILDKNGNVVGTTDRETITIADMDGDGDVDAWSNRMFNTTVDGDGNVSYEYYNIWNETDDLITGKYVIYNASKTNTTRLTLDDSGLTYPLAPETFFWTIGMIGESEVVLEYPVYLTGSMENTIDVPAGQMEVFETNKEAVLHYINYLGNSCTRDTVPPAFPWGNPAVGYVFYLVDENGNPLDNLGRVATFEESLKLSTVAYEALKTDEGDNVTTITASEKLAATDLAKAYQLYDPTASYSVVYDESWHNNGGKTTYVTQYGGADYSNAASSAAADMNGGKLDLEKTVVYFALMAKQPDAGLKVDKTVEATTDANEFILTLDAYATGHEIIRPADIVLVLDHSGSMRTPAGAPEVLKSGTLYTGAGAMAYDQLDETLGQHTGYYVAQSPSSKSWFVVRFEKATDKWFIYSVPHTEAIVNLEGWTEHTKTQSWTVDDIINNKNGASAFTALNFYKSQYAELYDAVRQFVAELKATGAEHRVAIVGFAGSTDNGSCVYVGGDETATKNYDALYNNANTTAERRAELYRKALKDVQDAGDYALLLSSIEAIETNYSYTCTSAGLKMASDLLAANEVDLTTRDRIVVLFTDGIPNVVINEEETTDLTDAKVLQIRNEIVSMAYAAKQQGAHVYAISTSTLGAGADRTFLKYASSDYPNATDYQHPGTVISPVKYTKEISSADALQDVFTDISQSMTVSSATIDETAVMKEVLSDYVQLDKDATVQYKVYTQDYLGDGKWGQLKDFNATVEIKPTTGRTETIEVTGFDYADNYVSEKLRTDPSDSSNTQFRGRKLVLKVYIESRDGFWGGNNVPTNKSSTAIYSDGKVIKPFPEPQVNVPIDVEVTAKDKTVYYGGEIDGSDEGDKEGDELIDKITIGGKDVIIDENGNITPTDDWMDDFVNASWGDESTKPDSDLENTEPKDYTYTVVVTPTTSGTTNNSDNPSNIAGNVDGGDVKPGDLTAPADTGSDDGHIFILVPDLEFKDSTTDFGTSADSYDYTSNDFVGIVGWKDMEHGKQPGDTTDGGVKIPELEAGAEPPEVDLTYEADESVQEEGKFVTDTKVDVTVKIGDDDITDLTGFHWKDDCDHTSDMDIGEHDGSENTHEFWVHVSLAILPDTVVIDFGLDVLIDVLGNDPSIGAIVPSLNGIAAKDAAAFGTDAVDGAYGKLSIDGSKVRYSLDKDKGMQMQTEDSFRYQVKYNNQIKGQDVLLDSTVTVIPATSIYYEDSFVKFSAWNVSDDSLNTNDAVQWKPDGAEQNRTQDEDRPGAEQALENVDANNIYGYDNAYTDMTTHSMGSAMKFTANRQVYGEAQFTFQGTGFDIVSLTSNTTGTITVSVYKADDFASSEGYAADHETLVVDTYYGYKYVDGEWVVDTDATGALYQVPVMKVSGLDYDRYTVVITVYYHKYFDHQENGSYDFYLDAIRIYDPANDGDGNTVIEGAYKDDNEGWPEYFELRNLIIDKETFDSLENSTVGGIVYIDNTADNKVPTIADYTNYGPNNELYLAPGQSIAFKLNATGDVAKIHLAMKTVGNGDATVQVFDAAKPETNFIDDAIETATDLYYDITELNTKNVVITNTGDSTAILSITNVKVTYNSEPAGVQAADYFTTSRETGELAVKALMKRVPVVTPLVITGQPADAQAPIGEQVCITVEAQGDELSYQWYYKNKDSDKFIRSGYTGKSYVIKITEYCNGRQVYCVVSDKYGNSVTSDVATMTRPSLELKIITQPSSVQVDTAQKAVVTLKAQGEGLTYQWYFRNKNSDSFVVSGYKSNYYSVTMAEYCNGRQLYCVVTDVHGNSVTSETVTITRTPKALRIISQPQDVQAEIGERITITVTAQGEGLTYQWYYKNKNSENFVVSGYKSNTYSLVLNNYCDGRQIYCVITDQHGNSVTTDTVTMLKAGT